MLSHNRSFDLKQLFLFSYLHLLVLSYFGSLDGGKPRPRGKGADLAKDQRGIVADFSGEIFGNQARL